MTSSKRKVSAIVPFFNEKNTLPELINRLKKEVDYIILVDDGSTDDWPKLISLSDNMCCLSHSKNSGKGKALVTGLEKSLEMGFDLSVTIDADLQHPPEYINQFLKEIENKDLVIGNRLKDISSMPIQRRMSNKITSGMINFKFHSDIIDSQNGFRAFRNEILSDILPDSHGFEAETEMLIKAIKNNLRIGNIQIPTIYGNTDSKMKPLQAIKGFLKVYFKY